MPSRTLVLCLVVVLALLILPACNNTLNPLCGSARPVPAIASLSPSTIAFTDVQQPNGAVLIVKGSHFVSASEIVINGKALSATITSSQQMNIALTTGVISGPGTYNVSVHTPSGGSGDLGCSSGGDSSALVLTIN